jgi:hypothetical protein
MALRKAENVRIARKSEKTVMTIVSLDQYTSPLVPKSPVDTFFIIHLATQQLLLSLQISSQ